MTEVQHGKRRAATIVNMICAKTPRPPFAEPPSRPGTFCGRDTHRGTVHNTCVRRAYKITVINLGYHMQYDNRHPWHFSSPNCRFARAIARASAVCLRNSAPFKRHRLPVHTVRAADANGVFQLCTRNTLRFAVFPAIITYVFRVQSETPTLWNPKASSKAHTITRFTRFGIFQRINQCCFYFYSRVCKPIVKFIIENNFSDDRFFFYVVQQPIRLFVVENQQVLFILSYFFKYVQCVLRVWLPYNLWILYLLFTLLIYKLYAYTRL